MDTHPDSFETHTETSTTGSQEASGSTPALRILGLVIVAHPDPERLGEEAPLREIAAGRSSAISRREPLFLPPGSETSPRPLADSHLSRHALHLTPGPGSGEVILRPGGSPTSVRVGGELIEHERHFSAPEIERGVVLILASRIALLLQTVDALPQAAGPDFAMVGHSEAINRLRREIQAAALLDVPVLLRGETGTGKELVARAVHDARPSRGPFLAVNLGALVPALAASELFGAKRGAYTGADRQREGYFSRAHRGTLFLDEIGEAPIEVQVLLLRALETGRVQAVGGVEEKEVEVRLVAATDADLEAAIHSGRFRSSLLHRLSGYEIHVPALRQRRDDIARLFFHFLDLESSALKPCADAGNSRVGWPNAEIISRLVLHDWPGNVRELKNVARRLAVLRHVDGAVDPGPLLDQLLRCAISEPDAESVRAQDRPASPARRLGTDVSSQELIEALELHAWQPGPTAKALGLSRPALYRLIEQHPDLRTAADLDEVEIREAIERQGSIANAALELRVSAQGLKRHLRALGQGRD